MHWECTEKYMSCWCLMSFVKQVSLAADQTGLSSLACVNWIQLLSCYVLFDEIVQFEIVSALEEVLVLSNKQNGEAREKYICEENPREINWWNPREQMLEPKRNKINLWNLNKIKFRWRPRKTNCWLKPKKIKCWSPKKIKCWSPKGIKMLKPKTNKMLESKRK